MRHNSILSILAKGLMAAAVAVSIPAVTWAQGITVKTKDGKSVDYPAEKFSHISPYIFEVSSTTYTQGAVATLQYEKAADLNVARTSHQVFATSAGLVVIGGHTTYYVPTETAELWQNGQWRPVATNGYPYDTGFSVTLSDGRVMVGGGYSEIGGLGGSAKTCIFNPATQTFVGGPEMTSARSNSKAIATSRGVYVSGNFGSSSTDSFFDFYNGSTFAKVGNPDPHYRPYLFTDAKGNVYTLSTMDNKGNTIALKQSSSGVTCLYGDKYDAAANKDYYYFYSAYATYMPLTLSADIRTEEYRRTDRNGFLVLAKNAVGNYLLTEPCPDEGTTYNHNKFVIPSQHPVTNALITWRGGVYVNNAKNEAYLIGSSGQEGNYTIHVISYNYKDYYWTIASASGFSYNLATASWTLMADGRLACTGGNTKSDARKDFYIITPPKAGMESSSGTKSYGIDIFKTDGTNDRYMESLLESVTTYEPKGEDEQGRRETTTVPQTGGKASAGTLTVDFPAGTFSGDAKVSIIETKQGYVDGDDELSQYYKVTISAGFHNAFKVSVAMPRQADDENVRMQIATMGWAPSLGQDVLCHHYLDVTYQDGAYVAEVPAMDAPDEAGNMNIYFGITKCAPVGGTQSRALAGSADRTDFKFYNKATKDPEAAAMADKLNEWIPDALDKLEGLGFKKEKGSVINCYLILKPDIITSLQGGGEADGWCTRSRIFKSWSEVTFRYPAFMGKEDFQIQGTVIHELFHYYQLFYDPRTALVLAQSTGGLPLILEEASSTWSERFYQRDPIAPITPTNAIEYAPVFVPSINPEHKDVVELPEGKFKWGDRYGDVGYGASSLLEYLTQKAGNKIVLEMWEDRKTGTPSDNTGIIERAAKKHGIDIFSPEGYRDFVASLGAGKVYPGIDWQSFVKDRRQHDSIGVISKVVRNTSPVYHTNYVYGYGALVEELEVAGTRSYEGDLKISATNVSGVIEQTTEGVTTWLYAKGKQECLGMTRKGSPLKLNPAYFSVGPVMSADFFFVTVADDFKTIAEPVSRIVSRVFPLEIPVKQVAVPSSPGTTDVTLKTSCYDLKFKTDANDWLTCYWSVVEQALKVRHEQMPLDMQQRKATIQVIALADDGKTDVVLDEIEITQVQAYINLSETDVKIAAEGGAKTVNVISTNCTDLKVDTKNLFLHPTINGNTITVKIDPNTSYDVREGSVMVSGTMPTTGIKVERFISFTQAAAKSPDLVNLWADGSVSVFDGSGDNWVSIPGQTSKYGDYLCYRSADTKVEREGTTRKETSWTVELYIDPKDNKSMSHYEFLSGSVTWLCNEYWTVKVDGKDVNHHRETRCSYNLKNLTNQSGLAFASQVSENSQLKLSHFVTDYSYEKTLDGKSVTTLTQTDIDSKRVYTWGDVTISLELADGVPYLEVNCDTLYSDGSDYFEIASYFKNDVVQSVEVTPEVNWITIENPDPSDHGATFYVKADANQSKAPRTGHINVTGTLPDGKKLTRTITLSQEYDPLWDDDQEWSEEQKPELPSQAVLDALQAHGMPIYLGSEPPRLRGAFIMEPLHTVYETNGNSSESEHVDRLVFNFSNITGRTDRAAMSYYSHLTEQNINTPADDYLCYLSGYSDFFTLSNIYKADYDIFTVTIVTVITGELDGGNIKNLHFASVELDKDGNIESVSIGSDGDGISPATTTWEPGDGDFARYAYKHKQ